MHDRDMRWFLVAAVLAVFSGYPAVADELVENGNGTAVLERSLTSLKNVSEPLIGAIEELEKLRSELEQAATEEAKQGIQIRIDAER